jgi:hypothetical protein
MADGVAITAGSGTTILTDDTGAGGHAQVMKLAISTDGSGTLVPADTGNGLDVDVTRLPALVAGSANIGDVDVLTVPAPLSTTGTGTEATALRVTVATDSTGVLSVDDNGGALTVDQATAANLNMTEASAASILTAVQLIDDIVYVDDTATHATGTSKGALIMAVAVPTDTAVSANDIGAVAMTLDRRLHTVPDGSIAHDTADGTSNPVKIGAKAETDLAAATMVADADRTDLYADIDGVQMVKPFCPFNNIIVERVSNTNGTSTAFSSFGATASARNMVTTFVVHNDSATDGYVDIRDGTAGTILLTIPAPQKGGAVINLPVPLRQTTANTALAYDVSAAITTVYITAIGFKSKA